MARKNKVVKLPEKVDLHIPGAKIYDQGELGASVTCAMVAALEYMLKQPPKPIEFLYYYERPFNGHTQAL